MTAPIALVTVIAWLKHPYEGTKEVEVNRVSRKHMIIANFRLYMIKLYRLNKFRRINS